MAPVTWGAEKEVPETMLYALGSRSVVKIRLPGATSLGKTPPSQGPWSAAAEQFYLVNLINRTDGERAWIVGGTDAGLSGWTEVCRRKI